MNPATTIPADPTRSWPFFDGPIASAHGIAFQVDPRTGSVERACVEDRDEFADRYGTQQEQRAIHIVAALLHTEPFFGAYDHALQLWERECRESDVADEFEARRMEG